MSGARWAQRRVGAWAAVPVLSACARHPASTLPRPPERRSRRCLPVGRHRIFRVLVAWTSPRRSLDHVGTIGIHHAFITFKIWPRACHSSADQYAQEWIPVFGKL